MSPRILRLVADEAGAAAALRLLEAQGGQRIYIARTAEGSPLAERIGLDAATVLSRHYGGEYVLIPSPSGAALAAHRREAVAAQPNTPANELARQLKVSARTIEKIRQELRQSRRNSRQLRLL